METIEVPEADYKKVSEAKERRTSRMIEGYTWQEERQMMIAEKFAGNEGTMGNVGGAVGGFMMGGAIGGSIVDIARNALDPEKIPQEKSPKDAAGTHPRPGQGPGKVDVNEFFKPKDESTEPAADGEKCPKCGADLPPNAKFCLSCGGESQHDLLVVCPNCGRPFESSALSVDINSRQTPVLNVEQRCRKANFASNAVKDCKGVNENEKPKHQDKNTVGIALIYVSWRVFNLLCVCILKLGQTCLAELSF